MDIIYTDRNLKQLGYLEQRVSIDMEVGTYLSGSKNDFEITIPADMWETSFDKGSIIFEDTESSEFGGRIQGKTSDTAVNKVILYGFTWRGLISKQYVKPPSGQAYYLARGDANAFLREMLDNSFDGLIVGNLEDAGIEINRDLRYTNKLEAIEKTLKDVGYRISIHMDVSHKRAVVSAVPIKDFSSSTEYSNDYGYALKAKDIENGYNHCICLGKGELTERTVIELFRLQDGTITTDEDRANAHGITGLNRRTMIYDYSSAENEDNLIQGGMDRLKENNDTRSLEISNVDHVDIGDIVGAKDRITDIYMQKEVTSKVITGNMNRTKIQYKVGD